MNSHPYLRTASKYALYCALAALPLQALAIDITPDADRIISDPLYLPLQGQIYGDTAYTWGRTTSDAYKSSTGTQRSSSVAIANDIHQTLEFGALDDLTITLAESYDWNKTDTDNSVTGANSASRSNGWTDPTFGVVWRALDQKEFPLTVDLRATYAPNWMPDQTDDANGTGGKVGTGGQVATFGLDVGYETRDITIVGLAGAAYHGARENSNQTTFQDETGSVYWAYDVGFNSEVRFTDEFSLNAGVTQTFTSNYNSDNTITAVSYNTDPGNNTSVNAALNYTIIPNHLVAGLTYNFVSYENTSTSYARLASDTDTQNHNENVFGARLQYAY